MHILTHESDMASENSPARIPDSMTVFARPQPRFVWLRQIMRSPSGMLSLVLIGLLVLIAVFAPWLAPRDPYFMDGAHRLEAPGNTMPLGSDEFGRDLLSRIIFGSRISLVVGIVSVVIAASIGAPIGIIAGYAGGWFDHLAMRVMDIIYSFPGIVLAMAITAFLGPSLTNTMLAIGIVYAPGFSRVVRGPVLAIMQMEYVQAARVVGVPNIRILLRHVLPNVTSPLIVASSVTFSFALLSEAALSYLGLGTQPPEPSWGTMLLAGKRFMEVAPWTSIFPGLAISLAVLGTNLLGDVLRDVLDPRLRI
jgi:peptide/nickel transport system permease protein